VNLLLLDQRHPLIVTTVGIASGLGSLIIDDAHAIGLVCTALLALIALVTKLVTMGIAFHAWRRKLAGRRFRKRMNRRDPAEDHLRFDDEPTD
jgi:hypothetical protein